MRLHDTERVTLYNKRNFEVSFPLAFTAHDRQSSNDVFMKGKDFNSNYEDLVKQTLTEATRQTIHLSTKNKSHRKVKFSGAVMLEA